MISLSDSAFQQGFNAGDVWSPDWGQSEFKADWLFYTTAIVLGLILVFTLTWEMPQQQSSSRYSTANDDAVIRQLNHLDMLLKMNQ